MLVDDVPALMHWCHVKPWELENMTPDELAACYRFIEANVNSR